MVILLVLCILVLLVIAASYVCCRSCFFVPKQTETDLFRLPDTEQYAPASGSDDADGPDRAGAPV